jgi:hypothetical protein
MGIIYMKENGKIVIIKCENCGKELYLEEIKIRQKMFCTIRCMESYTEKIPMTA